MASLNSFRSLLYALARLIGDFNAIRRGPKAIIKRQIRKSAQKSVRKWLR